MYILNSYLKLVISMPHLVNKTILLFLIPISVTSLSLRLFGFIGGKNLEKSRVWIFHFSPDFEMFCLASVRLQMKDLSLQNGRSKVLEEFFSVI